MNGRRPRRAAFVACVVAGLCAPTATASPAADDPSLAIDHDDFDLGMATMVEGNDFPAGEIVQITVCGNGGIGGSNACDYANAVQTAANDDGRFKIPIEVTRPPADCPCVIRATTLTSGVVVAVPITIRSVPTRDPPEPDLGAPIEVVSAEILDDGPVTAMLGGRDRRTVVLTIANHSSSPVVPVQITALVGPPDDVTRFVDVPDAPPVPAGGEIDFEFTVQFDRFAHGEHVVAGRVVYEGGAADYQATTSLPLLRLLAVPLFILLQVALVLLWRFLRRRSRNEPPADQPAEPPTEAVAAGG